MEKRAKGDYSNFPIMAGGDIQLAFGKMQMTRRISKAMQHRKHKNAKVQFEKFQSQLNLHCVSALYSTEREYRIISVNSFKLAYILRKLFTPLIRPHLTSQLHISSFFPLSHFTLCADSTHILSCIARGHVLFSITFSIAKKTCEKKKRELLMASTLTSEIVWANEKKSFQPESRSIWPKLDWLIQLKGSARASLGGEKIDFIITILYFVRAKARHVTLLLDIQINSSIFHFTFHQTLASHDIRLCISSLFCTRKNIKALLLLSVWIIHLRSMPKSFRLNNQK